MLNEAAPYLISLAILMAAIAAFFFIARGHYAHFGVAQVLLRVIAALPLVASGILIHFVHSNEATAMLPPAPSGLPSPKLVIQATGVLELLGALGLFIPSVRRSAALCIAIMMVTIFPVNVFVAGRTYFGTTMPSVPVRLAMQVAYIWIVLLAGYGRPDRSARDHSN